MKNGKYTLEDIDDRVIKYFDAYIKQTLKYTKIDFIKNYWLIFFTFETYTSLARFSGVAAAIAAAAAKL